MTPLLSLPPVLDGAMGTALIARGLAFEIPVEQWVLTRPDDVAAVHRGHVEAGAELLLTCTFNLAAPRLGDLDAVEVARRAVALARGAGARMVAGDLGPGWVYQPGHPEPDPAPVEAAYARAAGALAAAGADVLWVESQWCAAEAGLALRAARRTGLPVLVTFAPIAGGEPARALLAAAAAGGAAAVGVNCVPADGELEALARWAAGPDGVAVPFLVKPSPGLPGHELAPERFAAAIGAALDAGAAAAGGCCGATAAHVAAVARASAARTGEHDCRTARPG